MGTFGALAAVTALPALAATASNSFTIGSPSGAVTNISAVSVSPATPSTSANFSFTFTNSSGNNMVAGTDSITLGDSDSDAIIGSIPGTTITVADLTAGSSYGVHVSHTGTGSAGHVWTFVLGGTGGTCGNAGVNCIASGDTVEVTFTASTPSTASSYTLSIYTSQNSTSANTPAFAVSGSAPAAMTASAAPVTLGQNGSYTITDFTASLTSAANTTAAATELDVYTGSNTAGLDTTWPASGSATVVDTTKGVTFSATTTNTPPVKACPAGFTADCTLTVLTFSSDDNVIASGDSVNITGLLGLNPSATTTEQVMVAAVNSGNANGLSTEANANVESNGTSTEIAFGTSVSGVTLSLSPATTSSEATYAVSFTATNGILSGGDVYMTEPSSNFSTSSGYVIDDTTDGTFSANTGYFAWGGCPNTSTECIELPWTAAKTSTGAHIVVTITNVTNPSSLGTYTDFAVSDSTDTIGVDATGYSITSSVGGGIMVTPNPTTTAALSTWTISNFTANAAMTGGVNTIQIDDINCAGNGGNCTGLTLPNLASDYVITDNTTKSGSGTVSTIDTYVAGGGSVTFTVPENINSGDSLTITISDVINPANASSSDAIELTGAVSAVAPLVNTFPDANVSYPNGAIVDFSGTDYVFAGGHAFGIANPTLLTKLEAVDKATVLKAATGAIVPTAAPRVGTLITTNSVNSNPTIYVMGTGGEWLGFASATTLVSDGYDTALTVTVTNLGGVAESSTTADASGSAATALATSADGAIVDSSNTYYVFAGGRACGIATPAQLSATQKGDKAVSLTGTIGATQTGATIADGVLISLVGGTTVTVYVTKGGLLYPFKTPTQLAADGYAGTAAVPVPNHCGLTVSFPYNGS